MSHLRSASRFGVLVATLCAIAGCRQSPDPVGTPMDARPDTDTGYPPPRTDLVPAVGSDDTLDMATWNIENFPAEASTPAVVADLIASLDLDLVSVQEIADIASFVELLDRLPGYRGVLSSDTYSDGSYQKVGFVYRESVLEPTFDTLLFTSEGFVFPRPPLRVDFRVIGTDLDFVAIALHLKAGTDSDDIARRRESILRLEQFVSGAVAGAGDDDIVLLGDFNELVIGPRGEDVMGPWLDAPGLYDVHTTALAEDDRYSFIPSGVILDHVVSTASLSDEFAGRPAVIPALDEQLFGYESGISDHLPVIVTMPLAP